MKMWYYTLANDKYYYKIYQFQNIRKAVMLHFYFLASEYDATIIMGST